MDIKSVSNNVYLNQEYESKKTSDSSSPAKKVDSFELSNEAKKLSNKKMDPQKLAEIQQKINDKFYDSDEAIEKISNKIYNEIKETK